MEAMLRAIPNKIANILQLAAFLFVVLGAGALIGISAEASSANALLVRPPFSPPGWMFAPIWFAINVCIAVAGWRVWIRNRKSQAMFYWFSLLILSWLWSVSFFVASLFVPSLIVIVFILLSIVGFIQKSFNIDEFSSGLMVPCLLWVTFSSGLNLSVVLLN